MARPARRVDHTEAVKRAFLQRGLQCPVQDVLFHEDRRLKQRVRGLRVCRQILVEVAEKPRRQRLVVQVMDQPAIVRTVAPELDQFLDGVTGRRRVAERGVCVDQGLRRGQFAEIRDRIFEPLTFGPSAMFTENSSSASRAS